MHLLLFYLCCSGLNQSPYLGPNVSVLRALLTLHTLFAHLNLGLFLSCDSSVFYPFDSPSDPGIPHQVGIPQVLPLPTLSSTSGTIQHIIYSLPGASWGDRGYLEVVDVYSDFPQPSVLLFSPSPAPSPTYPGIEGILS